MAVHLTDTSNCLTTLFPSDDVWLKKATVRKASVLNRISFD